MNIDLGVLGDGSVMLVSSHPLKDVVKRVEYYRDHRMMMLVYHNEDELVGDLIEYEVPHHMALQVEAVPDIIIYSLFPNREPAGYKAPLIKVGAVD